MSEKQFKLSSETVLQYQIMDNDTDLNESEVVDLLNKLYEENEQLREILKDIVVATDETYTKNTSMFKVTVVLDYEKYREIRRCIE